VCLFAFQRKQCLCLLRNHTVFFYHLTTKNCRGARKLGNSTAKWMEQRKDATETSAELGRIIGVRERSVKPQSKQENGAFEPSASQHQQP